MTHPLLERRIGDRRLRVVASDRSDGDVRPDDVAPDTLAARQRAVTGRRWAMLDEVHGTDVVDVGPDSVDPHAGRTAGVGDVAVTRDLDVHLAAWAGDCSPIVLASDDGTLVVAHGGWRGLAAGVVDVAVDTATRTGGAVAVAVLGPVIHPCCYEFGAADLASIPHAVPSTTSTGDPALDVPATVSAQLAVHGIDLDLVGACTGCDDRWFSHRVRAERARHAVVAWWEQP